VRRVKGYTLTCKAPKCGKLFKTTRKDAKTCSVACRKALSRLTGTEPPVVSVKRKRWVKRVEAAEFVESADL